MHFFFIGGWSQKKTTIFHVTDNLLSARSSNAGALQQESIDRSQQNNKDYLMSRKPNRNEIYVQRLIVPQIRAFVLYFRWYRIESRESSALCRGFTVACLLQYSNAVYTFVFAAINALHFPWNLLSLEIKSRIVMVNWDLNRAHYTLASYAPYCVSGSRVGAVSIYVWCLSAG